MTVVRADAALAAIDDLLEDWEDGPDAARWAPPWDEPVVRDPYPVAEQLVHRGWDGHAARAYEAWLVRTAARRLQAEVAGALARVAQQVAPLIAELGVAARRAGEQLGLLFQGLQRAGVVHAPPPKDPRERALIARRQRNTGPPVGQFLATGQRSRRR